MTKKTNGNGHKRAIIWGRFSSDQQKDGDSKDRQERTNRDYAKRQNIEVIKEYFDEGTSVKDGATPLFREVIASLPDGVGIICENLDRISRGKPWRAKAMLLDIIEAGHFIITSSDGREYNEETIEEIDTLLLGDLSTNLARIENNKRTKRVKEAKSSAVELSRQGKPAPLGAWLPSHLKYNPLTKTYDVKEDRLSIIQTIFTDYAAGKGVMNITRDLNRSNHPTFRGNKIGQWTRSTIFTLLRYEGFIGVLNYKNERIPNAFTPIAISDKLFYKVQSILLANKSKRGNYNSENVNNVFRGVSKCSHCGSTMRVTKDGYIACYGYQIGKCKVKNMVKYHEMECEFIRWFVSEARSALLGNNDSNNVIDALQGKLGAIKKRIDRTLELLNDDTLTMPIERIKKQLSEIEMERQNVEGEIASTKSTNASKSTLPDTFHQMDELIEGAIEGNQETRKKLSALVPTILKRVDIDISNKWFPSFTMSLINGDVLKWEYRIDEFGVDVKGKGQVMDGGYSSQD